MILNLPWSPSQIELGRIPLQSHDQDPEVDKPPFQSIKETYIVFFWAVQIDLLINKESFDRLLISFIIISCYLEFSKSPGSCSS